MKAKVLSAIFILFFITGISLQAQVTIGADKEPDQNAVLELISNENKGLLLPRLELVEVGLPDPLTEHVAGMVVYNIGTAITTGYYFNDGSQWILISDTNSSPWRNADTGEPAESVTEPVYQSAQVGIGSQTIDDNAQLDVSSITRGVLLPRMNRVQRDAIPQEVANGLLIYNTTTNCFNYMDTRAQRWLSLCGTYEPARLEISDCTGGPSSELRVGQPLTLADTYTINVRVTEAGAYQIMLTTGNGYSYTKSGTYTETGVYTIVLEGQGTPFNVADGTAGNPLDVPRVELNGVEATPTGCQLENIKVNPSYAVYEFPCTGTDLQVTLTGTYVRGEAVTAATHYVDIPITVTNDGVTVIETQLLNGIQFSSGSVSLTTGMTTVRLFAQGTPTNVSNATNIYRYTPAGGSCSFVVPVTSDLGSFTNPAKSCLAILQEDPSKTDGEYWILQSSGSNRGVKTMCDMTRGGFTLIWSYSEYAARNLYGPSNDMSMYAASTPLRSNNPRNVITVESDTIVYYNHRLSRSTMQNAQNNNYAEYRIRIVYDPKDMNDPWGEENYMHIRPTSSTYDPVSSGAGLYTYNGRLIPTDGKIFNIDYRWDGTSGANTAYYGTSSSNYSPFYYGTSAYGNHWDSATYFGTNWQNTTITRRDGSTMTISVNGGGFNNIFGFFGELGTQHHFGKCGSGADDYAFSPATCYSTSKVPHSFNWNYNVSQPRFEGRYLQWWMK